jgi:hypothetical protein
MQRFTLLAVALVAALAPARRALSERGQGFRPGWLRAIALCTLFAFSACSATLTRRDDTLFYTSYEGTIVGSDADSVRIRTDSGSVEKVRRADIDDIDHPGNVLGTIGLVLGAGSVVSLSLLAGESHRSPEEYVYAVQWGLCLVTGAVLAIIGWSDYFASKRAANHFDRPRVVPVGVSPALPPSPPPPSAPASPRPPSPDPWE